METKNQGAQKTFTLREVVMITADLLRGIQVPVELSEQIGMPILGAIRNLKIVSQQMEEADVAAQIQNEAPAAQDKPENPEEGKENGRDADA